MTSPKIRSEFSVNTTSRGRQAPSPENSVIGARIIEALGDRSRSWLSRESGLPDSTIGDAIKRGPAKTDVAMKIATSLGVSLDWLLAGAQEMADRQRTVSIADASSAEWTSVPVYDLRRLNDSGKGEELRTIPVRNDWLYSTLGRNQGLWLTTMPCDYPPIDLLEGDRIFCEDVSAADLTERALCIWREAEWSQLFVGRFSAARDDRLFVDPAAEYWIGRTAITAAEGHAPDLIPVGRILGRPIAQIR